MTAPPPGPPVRGRVPVDGYLIEVAVIGQPAARDRVLAAWQPGAHLRSLLDGAWLLTLPATGSVRAEHAPGLPVRIGPDGQVLVWRHGQASQVDLRRLPQVDLSVWVDLDDLPVHLLAPVRPTAEDVVTPTPPPPKLTELRATARVGQDHATERVARLIAGREDRARRRAGRRAVGGRGGSAGAGQPSRRASSAAMGWLVRSPVGVLLRSRHERYVRALAEDFQHARFDEALRRAIALG